MSSDKKPLPTSPALTGKKVYLRPTTTEDMVNIQYWFLQSEPQTQVSYPLRFKTVAEAAEEFRIANKTADRESFTIVSTKTNVPIGRVTYYNYNSLNRSAALSVLIDPDERKKGFATQAVKLLVGYLFKYRDLNKVYADIPDFNKAGKKLMESLAFKKDGTLRGEYIIDGDQHARLIYSLMRFEWED